MLNVKKNESAKLYIKHHLKDVGRSTREKTTGKMLECPLPRTGPLQPPQADPA